MTAERPTPKALQAMRLIRLTLHLMWGLIMTGLIFPCVGIPRRDQLKQIWARQALAILAIQVDARFGHCTPGSLYIANHISWIDILALNAARPVAFVSKAEVRTWPVIGWLAEKGDTVFLRRGSRGHARVVNAEIDARLRQGRDVAVFPEGTTTEGTHLLHFHAALLQPAIESERPIQPVALSYHDMRGARSLAPAYVGDTSFMNCLRAVLATPALRVQLVALAPFPAKSMARRELAAAARAAIALSLGFPPEHTVPETTPGPPA